jgi:hypothetical protein
MHYSRDVFGGSNPSLSTLDTCWASERWQYFSQDTLTSETGQRNCWSWCSRSGEGDPTANEFIGVGIRIGVNPVAMASGIIAPFAIDEWPQTIWRPLERNFRSCDEKLRRVGFASVVITIRRWIGKGYSVHHTSHPHNQKVAQRSLWLRHQTDRQLAEAASVPVRLVIVVNSI